MRRGEEVIDVLPVGHLREVREAELREVAPEDDRQGDEQEVEGGRSRPLTSELPRTFSRRCAAASLFYQADSVPAIRSGTTVDVGDDGVALKLAWRPAAMASWTPGAKCP